MDAQNQTDHQRTLGEKARDALHNAACKTKKFAHRFTDKMTGGTEAKVVHAEEHLAELQQLEHHNKLEEQYLEKEIAKAVKQVDQLKEKEARETGRVMIDEETIVDGRERKVIDQQPQSAHVLKVDDQQRPEKCHEAIIRNDPSHVVRETTHITGIY